MPHLEAEKLAKTFIAFELWKLLKLFYVSGQIQETRFLQWTRIQISLTYFQGESKEGKYSVLLICPLLSFRTDKQIGEREHQSN